MGALEIIRRTASTILRPILPLFKGDILPPGWILHDTTSYSSSSGSVELPSTPEQFFKEYRTSIWVYNAVSAKARACAGVPILLKRKQPNEDEVVTDHPILRLFERPSVNRLWAQFIEALVIHLEMSGNAYVEKVRQKKKKEPIFELHNLIPTKMKTLVDPKKGIVGYIYSPNFREIRFSPDEIVHFYYVDPLVEERGMGPMVPAWLSSKMDTASQKFNALYFERGGVPNVVLKTPGPVPPVERKRIREEWQDAYGGVSNAMKVAVLPYGLEFAEVGGATHRDMQFDKLRMMTREEIHAAFRVPPILTGILEGATYATAYAQLEVFRDQTLIPLMRTILAILSYTVVEEYPDGKDLYLDVDLAGMKFPDETDKEYGRTLNSFNAKLLTLDETRARMGYPPLTAKQRKELEESAKADQEKEKAKQPMANPLAGILQQVKDQEAKNGNGSAKEKEKEDEDADDVDVDIRSKSKSKKVRR